MSELDAYRQQLAQVEAALQVEPTEELRKLAEDLKELIALQSQVAGGSAGASAGTQATATSTGTWAVGDECEAVWSQDGQYYNAIIKSFSEDGLTATVSFPEYDDTDVVSITSLRRRGGSGGSGSAGDGSTQYVIDKKTGEKKTKEQIEAEKQRKREKAKKRKAKLQQIEQDLEQSKSKWKSFATKRAKKKGLGSGQKGKSIFATPDNPEGKVGVGTCGIGGKAMTEYQQQGKWKFEPNEE